MTQESDDLAQARQEFTAEVTEGLGVIAGALIALEEDPGQSQAARDLFRVVHTIKGNASFFGYDAIERLCHAMEDHLGAVRAGKKVMSTALVSLLLRCNDCLGGLVGEMDSGQGPFTAQVGGLVAELTALHEQAPQAPVPPPAPDAPPAADEPPPAPAVGTKEASPAAEGVGHVPPETGEAPSAPVGQEQTSAGAPAPPPPTADEATSSVTPATGRESTIRVSTPLLDNLMNLVGELVLTRNQLCQQGQSKTGGLSNDYLQRLNAVTTALQESILKTRMQPIGQVLGAVPRQVRELCLALEKECRVDLFGGETELDRTLLEGLKDALTHLVRNAVDHGLEPPAQRQAAGKPPRGSLALRAYHEGGRVHLVVQDDGRGFDVEAIKAKALRQNLVSEAALGRMDAGQVLELVFHPGFSTKDKASNISGRGVGMDVVKTRIESLGGTVTLQSVQGRGVSVHLTLPLTLAILPAIMICTGQEVMAIPQASVKEVVQLTEASFESQVRQVSGGHMLRLRDRLLPLYALQGLLGGPTALQPGMFGLVLDTGGRVLVVGVDQVMDTEEIVVKPLSRELGALGVYSGGTIRGGGEAALILDPAGLAKRVNLHEENVRHAHHEQACAEEGEMEALLLLEQGGATLAIRLGDVQRLERVAAQDIQQGAGRRVLPYRGRLMNLVMAQDWLPVTPVPALQSWPVVVLNQEPPVGFCVEKILDAVTLPKVADGATPVPGVTAEVLVGQRAVWLLDAGALRRWAGERLCAAAHSLSATGGETGQKTQTRNLSKKKVLVVDDSKAIRHLLKTRLEAEGYQVAVAEDGVVGLAQLKKQTPDLIISDVNMPNMDGISFVEQVRQQEQPGRHVPVIAVSNERDEETVKRGREAGFDDYLFKLNMNEVIHALEDRFRQALEGSTP